MEQKPIVPVNSGPSVQYCCVLLEQLKKHLCILYQEAQLLRNVEEEFMHRKTVFNECNSSINNRLLYLWALSDQQQQDRTKNSMRNFLIQTTKNWKATEEKIAQESVSLPIFCRTSPNITLSTILEKTQYVADSTKYTFQTITAHFLCSRHAAYLYNEIMCAIARLSGYIAGAHYSLLMSRLTPYLLKLDATLETVVKTGSSEGVQPPPGPSSGTDLEDSSQAEQKAHSDHSCASGPTAPSCRDPMFTVDGKLAPTVQVPAQLCAGPFPMPMSVRLQRLLRSSASQVSLRTATIPANTTGTASTITVKAEPPDPDAYASPPHATVRTMSALDNSEEECDLLPIKMPRLESGLLSPLP
ncbi:uncharacterized protein LOC126284277 isoform X2 [Schistocerca gregaria]|uniref:uncharacterized protein LOC126284277 isoform X2 n=1 Tax=Schistocerca gregaria TaxID=7010 RepID=UPI00211E60F8|nr:uncharacterized protein LOC126284277 isoform X2 [Schistocerca gregaria]XP_049839052.1 uncharacterized protein LOC126284277 isoform X2 [Schistocerca gregaria]